jgi:hypothetical protein
MNAHDILHEAGMSARAAYYTGRGATLSDLEEKHLNKIWELITKYHGNEAAKSFVKMVGDMKEMSATSFINELYSLEGRKWKFTKVAGHGGVDFDKDSEGNYNLAQGMFAMASMLGGGNRDDSAMIRNGFLRSHGGGKLINGGKKGELDKNGRHVIY